MNGADLAWFAEELAKARAEERARIADRIEARATKHLATENKFAANGSYDSAAELAAWKQAHREIAAWLRDGMTE